MKGLVVLTGKDPLTGVTVGARIGLCVFPIPNREGDIRLLEPGQKIDFMTKRNGDAEIITPRPRVGCEREK